MDELLPRLLIDIQGVGGSGDRGVIDPAALFPRTPESLHLEIGFGGGEHLAAQALAHPEVGFIGCEPFVNGVAHLLGLIEEHHDNIRLWPDDARVLLGALPEACIERVFILFPDPWPKSRHHKRRLIQTALLAALARVMKPGAELRLATDHADYLTWMLERLLASPDFAWTARSASDWREPPPGWVRTQYQDWAEREGRAITWLVFRRAG